MHACMQGCVYIYIYSHKIKSTCHQYNEAYQNIQEPCPFDLLFYPWYLAK